MHIYYSTSLQSVTDTMDTLAFERKGNTLNSPMPIAQVNAQTSRRSQVNYENNEYISHPNKVMRQDSRN